MAYINFQDDPIAKRFNNSFANLCAGDPTKKVLRLLDKCFNIYNKGQSEASFCNLKDFLYPVDSYQLINFEVCAGDTLSLFNNDLPIQIGMVIPGDPDPAHPGDFISVDLNYPFGLSSEYIAHGGIELAPEYYILPNDKNFSRGCLLYIDYPKTDKNGEDIMPANMSSSITLESFTNGSTSSITLPLAQLFSHFSNPETLNANNLINKIEITNPNPNFSIKVSGLIVYLKSNNDPNNCAC
jgi:hypothetical protein